LLINLCKFQLCGEVKAIEIAYPDWTMHYTEAGIHQLEDGSNTYVCDCASCLNKNAGKLKQVHRNTYFKHKTGRLAVHPFPTPSVLSGPWPPTPVAAGPSSSKHPLDAPRNEEQTSKKGRIHDPTVPFLIEDELSDPVIDRKEGMSSFNIIELHEFNNDTNRSRYWWASSQRHARGRWSQPKLW
jgi:hypothetical protein